MSAQAADAEPTIIVEPVELLTEDELVELVSPIALYPGRFTRHRLTRINLSSANCRGSAFSRRCRGKQKPRTQRRVG